MVENVNGGLILRNACEMSPGMENEIQLRIWKDVVTSEPFTTNKALLDSGVANGERISKKDQITPAREGTIQRRRYGAYFLTFEIISILTSVVDSSPDLSYLVVVVCLLPVVNTCQR